MKEKLINILPPLQKLVLAGCVFMTPLVFFTNLTKNPYIVQDLLLALLLCIFLICWGINSFIKREITLKFSKIDILMLAFAAVSLVSLFYNLAAGDNFTALIGEFSQKGDVFIFSFFGGWFLAKEVISGPWEKFRPEFYFHLLLWSLGWFLFNVFNGLFFWVYAVLMWSWAAYICFKRLDKITFFALGDIFLAVCAICCFYGILQNAGMEMIWKININYEFGSRAVSTFGNPNFLSSYLVLFLPFAFLRFMKAKTGGEKFTFFVLLFAFCAYLAISMTRSSWLGILFAGILLLLFKDFRALLFKAKARTVFIILFCCLVFFLWPSGQKDAPYSSAAAERIEELNTLGSASALGLNVSADKVNFAYHQRLMMWACGLEMFKDSPIIGKGLTSFQMNYGLCQGGLMFKNPALGELKTQANEAHNQFVQVLAESGALGFILFITFLGFGAFCILRAVFKEQNSDIRLMYLCFFAGLAAFVADNMLNITFRAVITAFAFWFVFGALNNLCCAEKRKRLKALGAYCILIASLFLAGVAAYWQIDYFRAEIDSLKGEMYFAKGEFRKAVDLLSKADKNSAVRAAAAFSIVNSLIELREYDDALVWAQRGIKKYPGYYEFYLRLAGIKSGLGSNLQAAEYLKKALLLYPQNLAAAQAWAKLVTALPQLRTADNAESALKFLKFFPHEQDLKLAYQLSSFSAGDYQSACRSAQESLAFDIFNPDFYEIAKLCQSHGFDNAALIKTADSLKTLRAEIKKVKYSPALEKKAKSIYDKDGDTVGPALLLAEVYFNKGDYKAATRLLEPYYKADKYLKPLCFALSSAYLKAGEVEKAKEPLEAILSYDKHDEQALARLKNIGIL